MAQRVEIVLVDDMDGAEAQETVQFGLDGINYEIDLSGDNAARLRAALAEWVEKGRRVGGRKAAGRAALGKSQRKRPGGSEDMRQWARNNGYEVKDRGRVPAEIIAAYEAAQR